MEINCTMIEAHIFKQRDKGIEFLLLKRSEKEIYPGLWQMVSGKIHEGEKAFQTALREIKEETGLTPTKLWVAPNVNHFYDHINNCISVLPVFAALVNSDCEIKLSDEHAEFMWKIPAEAKKFLAWEGQRKSVDIITEYFTKEIHFLNFVEINLPDKV